MLIFYIVYISQLIVNLFLNNSYLKKIFVVVSFILLTGLYLQGVDWIYYEALFNKIDTNNLILNFSINKNYEKGFVLLFYYLKKIGVSFNLIRTFSGMLFLFTTIKIAKVYLKKNEVYLFIGLSYYYYYQVLSEPLMRQQIAIVLILLFYNNLLKKRYLCSLILIISSYYFHKSSLVFLGIPILLKRKISYKKYLISFIIIIIIGYFFKDILKSLSFIDSINKYNIGYMNNKKYSESVYGLNTLKIFIEIGCFLYLKKKEKVLNNSLEKIYYLYIIFLILGLNFTIFNRMLLYIEIYKYIIIVKILNNNKLLFTIMLTLNIFTSTKLFYSSQNTETYRNKIFTNYYLELIKEEKRDFETKRTRYLDKIENSEEKEYIKAHSMVK